MSRQFKDVDSAGRAQRLQLVLWSMIGGIVIALAGALKFGVIGFVAGWVLGGIVIYGAVHFLAGRAGNVMASVYMSSGSSTPARREYSLGDALAAQGKLQEAVQEFERCAATYPNDPEPFLRKARLLRDRLQQPQESAQAFRRALQVPSLELAHESAILRELSELYIHKLREPMHALPLLARLAERHAQSPAGLWARREIADIKQEMREQRD